jgi:hypothetical protein
MVSPGLRISSCASETGAAPRVVTQTSPVDLLTDQVPPSAANASEALQQINDAIMMRVKPAIPNITTSCSQIHGAAFRSEIRGRSCVARTSRTADRDAGVET